MPKCYIDVAPNGTYRVIDAKYGEIQGEYSNDGYAVVAAVEMGYELSRQ